MTRTAPAKDKSRVALPRRFARALLPRQFRHELATWWFEVFLIRRFPDRCYIERELLPASARRGGELLFVGCRRYTRRYPALLEMHGARCWTIDVDPSVARWGAPGRHKIGAIQEARHLWPAASFETIIMHGVFGYGLDAAEDQADALLACHTLMKPGGWLILGWQTDLSAEPLAMRVIRAHFQQVTGWRKTFSPVVIDVFSRVDPMDGQG